MHLRTRLFQAQKYEASDMTKFSLKNLKRKYELGMVFIAMLQDETDERAVEAVQVLRIQLGTMEKEWKARMAFREYVGLPTIPIWEPIPSKTLRKIANRPPPKGLVKPQKQVIQLSAVNLGSVQGGVS